MDAPLGCQGNEKNEESVQEPLQDGGSSPKVLIPTACLPGKSAASMVDVIQHTASILSRLQTEQEEWFEIQIPIAMSIQMLMQQAFSACPLGVWDYLDHNEIMYLSMVNSWWLGAAPWRILCESFWRCNDERTAEALGGWRPAFGAFSYVVKVGEEGKVAELTACLRGIQRLAQLGGEEFVIQDEVVNHKYFASNSQNTMISIVEEENIEDEFSDEDPRNTVSRDQYQDDDEESQHTKSTYADHFYEEGHDSEIEEDEEDPRKRRRNITTDDEESSQSETLTRKRRRHASIINPIEDDLWCEFISEDPRRLIGAGISASTTNKRIGPPPLASLARIVCGATARAFADEHTRLALCKEREQCASAVVAAISAWPHDARLAERGTRTLVYIQLAGTCFQNVAAMHATVRSAYDRHGKSHPIVTENACAYALAVSTEYTKFQNTNRSEHYRIQIPQIPPNSTRDRSTPSSDPSVRNLELLAITDFYDGVVLQTLANGLNHSTRHKQWNRKYDTVLVYSASALRELAVAAKNSRSTVCLTAVNRLRDILIPTLFGLALQPGAPERVIKCVLTALSKIVLCSPRHHAIYARLAPKARAAFAKRGMLDSANREEAPYYQSPRHFAEYVVTPRQHRTDH
mmetsp:Transcript_23270/g.30149  ORF Transcript_23270/g.30149 Transcript_23270/m.30149 type:complete len:632 (+) Transcript_23270:54-1949(+)